MYAKLLSFDIYICQKKKDANRMEERKEAEKDEG